MTIANQFLTVDWLNVIEGYYRDAIGFLDFAQPLICETGAIISSTSPSTRPYGVYWFLVPNNANIEPISSSTTYTVPVGKKYIINNIFVWQWVTRIMTIGGVTVDTVRQLWNSTTDISMNCLHNPIVLEAWDSIDTAMNHFWCLIPTDFSV